MSNKSKALQLAVLAFVVGGLSVACGLEVPEFLGGSQGGSDSGSGSEPTTEPAPDGTTSPAENGRIAYQALIGDVNSFEGTDIYSNDPQGGDEQRITDDGGAYPSYSPDSSKVVFHKEDGIYVAEADGSGETQLTEEPSDAFAAFSADGEFIAFEREAEREIYIMKADGSAQEPLTNRLGELFGGLGPTSGLAWNPHEMEIAFSANDGGTSDIYTVDFPEGDNLVQVTDGGLENFSPNYSPDGQTIVYEGDGDIYTIAADGSERGNPTRITDDDFDDGGPVFSPDGERIAFSSDREGDGYDIFTMDAETGNNKFNVTKTSDLRSYATPSWSAQESSEDPSGDSGTRENTGSPDDSEEASLHQAVGDYYRAAGAEEWAYTYGHLDSQTQSMFTEEEWSRKNQWLWDSDPTVYHILSINLDTTSQEPLAEVEVSITGEDGFSWARTTYFVQEDGEWLHRFGQEEIDLFMPGVPFEEFVEAQAGTSSNGACKPLPGDAQDPDCLDHQQSGFEQFIGDWHVHGSQMVIRADFTGMKSSNTGPCTDPFGPSASDAMCSEIQQLEFSETPSGGIVATVTSIDHETWEGDSPPPGFEPDGTTQVGDSFELEFVDDNLLRTTWLGSLSHLNGQGNPYWCNSQTSDENIDTCGA